VIEAAFVKQIPKNLSFRYLPNLRTIIVDFAYIYNQLFIAASIRSVLSNSHRV